MAVVSSADVLVESVVSGFQRISIGQRRRRGWENKCGDTNNIVDETSHEVRIEELHSSTRLSDTKTRSQRIQYGSDNRERVGTVEEI